MSKKIIVSGKRKKAVARATVEEGNGKVRFNGQPISNISSEFIRLKIQEPLFFAEDTAPKLNIDVEVKGGGIVSQADAARLAIAKGLVAYNPKLKKTFLDYDRTLLVADVRQREPRKPNTGGHARAKTQKSYR
ncbi:TPA: 30S ribosomal protein S9 [Candidatus Woesearchaeota archaeon]|nr:30S ribosomal protein S9 [Candidatus Woesearchaeota archaeon]HIH39119.1 30S ribosomal protein S9 [Candidatus Woesearchaeota archaeon]